MVKTPFEDNEDDFDFNACLNCNSIWAIGSEEWELQQCYACGWMPGEPTIEDLQDPEDYLDNDDYLHGF